MGLKGSKATEDDLEPAEVIQLVVDEMLKYMRSPGGIYPIIGLLCKPQSIFIRLRYRQIIIFYCDSFTYIFHLL